MFFPAERMYHHVRSVVQPAAYVCIVYGSGAVGVVPVSGDVPAVFQVQS